MMEDIDVPEGFKMTELGLLPEEWNVIRFLDVISENAIKLPRSIPKSQYQRGSKYPIIDQSKDFIAGYTDDSRSVLSEPMPVIVFGDHTRIFKFIDFPFAIGADGTKIIVPEAQVINPRFLFYYFLDLEIPNRGYNRHFKILREKRIARPPLSEQEQIAFVLSTIQQAMEKTEAVINATKELKKSMMKHLFTYGPVSVEDTENVVLKETTIGLMPEEWKVVELGGAGIVLMGQSPPGESYNIDGIGVPLINGPAEFGELFPTISKWTSNPTKICEKGDILFCVRGNTTGRLNSSNMEYCIGRGVAAIRGADGYSETLYLFYLLEKEKQNILQSATSGGSTFPNITKTQIESLMIPLPSLLQQHKIASMLSIMDQKIETERAKKKALEELFKTLLHSLMTGRIRVTYLEVPHD